MLIVVCIRMDIAIQVGTVLLLVSLFSKTNLQLQAYRPPRSCGVKRQAETMNHYCST